jgi:hypothetical protein
VGCCDAFDWWIVGGLCVRAAVKVGGDINDDFSNGGIFPRVRYHVLRVLVGHDEGNLRRQYASDRRIMAHRSGDYYFSPATCVFLK